LSDGYKPSTAVDREPVGWRKILALVLCVLAYMTPLFWMWSVTGYPDSFGVHITAHGRAGLIESWGYSYLLLNRHYVLDLLLFAYMWTPAVPVLAWLGGIVWQAHLYKSTKRSANASRSSDVI
jgi:hypothetical protein